MTGTDGSTAATWSQLTPTDPLPPVRVVHGAVYDAVREVMIAYGGEYSRNDTSVWVLSLSSMPGNNPPVAFNDSYSTDEDTALTVAAPGVIGNDTDAENNPLTAILVAGIPRER